MSGLQPIAGLELAASPRCSGLPSSVKRVVAMLRGGGNSQVVDDLPTGAKWAYLPARAGWPSLPLLGLPELLSDKIG